jgi:hypothetical protein
MFKKPKNSRVSAAIISTLVLMVSGVTPATAERSSSMNANPGSDGRTFINVDCTANPDALLQPPYNKNFDLNTTFNITGACNGPLYITTDGIRLVGVDESAAIVLPGPPTDPSGGAVFGDGAHDLRIENLLIDASAWGTGAIANGTDAAGIYARNSFIRVINTRILGGQFGINPFRNAIVRTQGLVEITGFVNSAISVGDQSLVTARGPVVISTDVTDGSYLYAVDVYRSGVMDFRAGVTINLPPENEDNNFFPNAIGVYRQSHLRIRSSGFADIQGAIFVNSLGSANIDGANIGEDLDVGGGSNVTLNSVTIEGSISAEDGSTVTLNSVNQTGDIEVSTGSVLNMNGGMQTDGEISVENSSALKTEHAAIGLVSAYLGATIQIEGGSVDGVELRLGSLADISGASVMGDIGLFRPSSINIFQEDFGTLNGNTIYLCGTNPSFIDPALIFPLGSGFTSPSCLP